MQAIEMFAGAGGLAMGVSEAGFLPIEIVEWDRWCCDTIRENRLRKVRPVSAWPNPIEADIRQLAFGRYEGLIDVVTGGPPCQPFSLGGKHAGPKDGRDLWPEAVRIVRETKPRAFIFENVKGLTRESFASYLSYIFHQLSFPEVTIRTNESWHDHLSRLEREQTAGTKEGVTYQVVYRVLNAANFGVPQRRERVVFVGFRSDLGIQWSFPEPTHSLDALLWSQRKAGEYWGRHRIPKREQKLAPKYEERAGRILQAPRESAWQTVRDAITDLPDPEFEQITASTIPNHRFQPGAKCYPGHTGSPLDEPAKTLKAGVHGVPGGENMLARPDGSHRYFTVRESARLQTFPDSYRLHGSWTEAMRQLGNAVPVELARVIAKSVRQNLMRERRRKNPN